MTGRYIYPNSIRKMMDLVVTMNLDHEIKLPHLNPNILRHTACTRMAEDGFEITTLQYIMGDSDFKTTLQINNHVNMGRIHREGSSLHQIYTNLV